MKVGIVVPYSWSFWGGVQEHADHQARALQGLGIEAKIMMGNDPPGRLTKLLHPKEGRHTPPPDYVIPLGRSVIVPANASLPNIILSPPALLRLRRVFAVERFDSHGYVQTAAPDYMLGLVTRGADFLAGWGRVDAMTAEGLKAEARRRAEAGSFFGFIALAYVVGIGPAAAARPVANGARLAAPDRPTRHTRRPRTS